MPREPEHPLLGPGAAAEELRQLQAEARRSPWLSALRWKWLLHRHSELFAATGVQIAAQLLAHPLHTLRVREQARGRLQDVCGVERHRAREAPLLRGWGYTLALAALGALAVQATAQWVAPDGRGRYAAEACALLAADALTAPFRHFLELRRCLRQLGVPGQALPGAARRSFGAFLARDLGFRCAYFLAAEGARAAGAGDLPALLVAGLLATLLTTPFDVCFTRLVGQRIARYASLRAALGAVFREEGPGRLAAGSALRLLAFTGPALAARWLTRPLREELDEAFAPQGPPRRAQNNRD